MFFYLFTLQSVCGSGNLSQQTSLQCLSTSIFSISAEYLRKIWIFNSQGSVAMCLMWGGYCCVGLVANFIRFPAVQIVWTSVTIWQSYREFKGGNFFWDTVYFACRCRVWFVTPAAFTRRRAAPLPLVINYWIKYRRDEFLFTVQWIYKRTNQSSCDATVNYPFAWKPTQRPPNTSSDRLVIFCCCRDVSAVVVNVIVVHLTTDSLIYHRNRTSLSEITLHSAIMSVHW